MTGYGYLLVTILLYGNYSVLIKIVVKSLNPLIVAAGASIPWTLSLLIVAFIQTDAKTFDLTSKDVLMILGLGLYGALMTFFNFKSTAILPVSHVIIGLQIAPAIGVLSAFLVHGDKLTMGQMVSLGFVTLGLGGLFYFKN